MKIVDSSMTCSCVVCQEPETKAFCEDDLYGNTLSRLEMVGPGLSCAYTHMDLQNRCALSALMRVHS